VSLEYILVSGECPLHSGVTRLDLGDTRVHSEDTRVHSGVTRLHSGDTRVHFGDGAAGSHWILGVTRTFEDIIWCWKVHKKRLHEHLQSIRRMQ